MFDQILDNYRKAAEATMRLQQDMMKNWALPWHQMPGFPMPGANWAGQVQAAQKKWADSITDMLTKHRETLDAQYRAGIRTIEDAFRVGEARDPEQFRKLTEELWRQSFECLRAVTEAQMRDLQSAMQQWCEVASQGAAAVKM
jgi:hypothetical protein